MSRRVHSAVLLLMLMLIFYLIVVAVNYHEDKDVRPRVWLLRSHQQKGFGIYVNGTVWELTPANIKSFLRVDAYELSTSLCPTIFDSLKYVESAFEEGAYLTRSNTTTSLYLINPTLRNKWEMLNASNAYHYGIDPSKATVLSLDLLSAFPTQYYF